MAAKTGESTDPGVAGSHILSVYRRAPPVIYTRGPVQRVEVDVGHSESSCLGVCSSRCLTVAGSLGPKSRGANSSPLSPWVMVRRLDGEEVRSRLCC